MGVGQLSESDAVDALRLPFYSSRHPTRSHGWGNLFDLGNPSYIIFIGANLIVRLMLNSRRRLAERRYNGFLQG